MCTDFCGTENYEVRFPIGSLVDHKARGGTDYGGTDRFALNPWKVKSIEMKGGCVHYCLTSGGVTTYTTGNSLRPHVEPEAPRSNLICCSSDRCDPELLIEFQREFLRLISLGVPPRDVVRNWNDSQDSFWNKVYLVENK